MRIWILWPALAALVRVPMDYGRWGCGCHWRLILGAVEFDVYRTHDWWRLRVFAGLGAWDEHRGWSLTLDVQDPRVRVRVRRRDIGFHVGFMARLAAAGF